jgi:ATP dependent DNA ligase domain
VAATKHNGIYTRADYPHLFEDASLPPGTCLDCELLRAKEQVYVFDVLSLNNDFDVMLKPLHERRKLLEEELYWTGRFRLATTFRVKNLDDVRKAYSSAVSEGYEGLVLKDATSFYRTPGAWLKLRETDTVDAVVMALVPTAATFATGAVWTYQVGLHNPGSRKLEPFGEVSSAVRGFDRSKVKVGSVLELRFNVEGGKLQWPATILRIRDDKLPEECLTTQV